MGIQILSAFNYVAQVVKPYDPNAMVPAASPTNYVDYAPIAVAVGAFLILLMLAARITSRRKLRKKYRAR